MSSLLVDARQSRSDPSAARLAAMALATTQPPDADTRLFPHVVDRPVAEGLRATAPGAGKAMRQLVLARIELGDALSDLHPDRKRDLQMRIRHAQTLRELWHLRPQVFTLISMERDQGEAHARLRGLDKHFPPVPRSRTGPRVSADHPRLR